MACVINLPTVHRSASTAWPTRSASASTSRRSSSVRPSLFFTLSPDHFAHTRACTGPSIGKLDAAAAAIEPTARGSLFSTSTARARPAPSAAAPAATPAAESINPLSAAAMRMPAYPSASQSHSPAHDEEAGPWADARSAAPAGSAAAGDIDVQALAQAAMQRPQFALDEAAGDPDPELGAEGDAAEGDEYGGEGELLGAVDAMLEDDDEQGRARDGALLWLFPLSLCAVSLVRQLADATCDRRPQLCKADSMRCDEWAPYPWDRAETGRASERDHATDGRSRRTGGPRQARARPPFPAVLPQSLPVSIEAGAGGREEEERGRRTVTRRVAARDGCCLPPLHPTRSAASIAATSGAPN